MSAATLAVSFRQPFGLLKQHPLGLRLRAFFDLGLDFFNQGYRFRLLDLKGGVHVRALRQTLLIRLV